MLPIETFLGPRLIGGALLGACWIFVKIMDFVNDALCRLAAWIAGGDWP
jgi:hypothetical protein